MNMTRNQIEYQNMLETKRHNRATEVESNRSNLAKEGLQRAQNVETTRHNTVSEFTERSKVVETGRSNLAKEAETKRHNVTVEQESALQNLRTFTETQRHNQATESINAYANTLYASEIANQFNIDQQKIAESRRHNTVQEAVDSRNASTRLYEAQNDYEIATKNLMIDRKKLEEQNSLWDSQQFQNYTKGSTSIVDSVLDVAGFIPGLINDRAKAVGSAMGGLGSLLKVFK